MICKTCRRANDPGEEGLHKFCRGSTSCDCQHKTGKFVIREVEPATK